MDEPADTNEIKILQVGSIVRVGVYRTSISLVPESNLGIVIEIENGRQTSIFPIAKIYNFSSKKITREFTTTLEIVSATYE